MKKFIYFIIAVMLLIPCTVNAEDVTIAQDVTVAEGAQMIIDDLINVSLSGELTNYGTIEVNGTLTITEEGTFTNYGKITGTGSIIFDESYINIVKNEYTDYTYFKQSVLNTIYNNVELAADVLRLPEISAELKAEQIDLTEDNLYVDYLSQYIEGTITNIYNFGLNIYSEGGLIEKIENLDDAIQISLQIPDITEVEDGYERQYYISTLEDGEITTTAAAISDDGDYILVDTDYIFLYIISYVDTLIPVDQTDTDTDQNEDVLVDTDDEIDDEDSNELVDTDITTNEDNDDTVADDDIVEESDSEIDNPLTEDGLMTYIIIGLISFCLVAISFKKIKKLN